MPYVSYKDDVVTNKLKEKSVNHNKNQIDNIIKDIIIKHDNLIYSVNQGTVKKDVLLKEIEKMVDKHNNISRRETFKKIIDFLFGYGILQDLITDEEISDIDFTRYDHCTIKKNGKKQLTNIAFQSNEEFDNFCRLLLVRRGVQIDENNNFRREADENYRLRFSVSIPPRNVTGTSLLIRKHRMDPYNLNDLVSLGMLNNTEKRYFIERIKNLDKNIIISGKGGAGKTTLLRAILMEANPLDRFLACEKDTELYLNNFPNFIIQRIKKREDGGKEVKLVDLVRDGLTMSLDAIVVGEMVDIEAWDLICAGNTDHNIYSTIHANNGREECIERILTLIDTANLNLPIKTIKKIISNSIGTIVYMNDFRVTEIVEIESYDYENDKFNFKELELGG